MNKRTPTLVAAMPGTWQLENPGTGIILVSDEQFLDLAEHPDKPVEQIHPHATEPVSLREHCRRAAARGATQMRIAYDYFFGGSTRSLYPDSEAFQAALKKVHDVAAEYGLGLEPSILSPLELGHGYRARTGESGRWMQYRETLRDPSTGQYSVSLWRHLRWCNNKGPTPVKLVGARAFAYHEERLPGTPFFAVDPASIVELEPPELEEMPGATARIPMLDGGEAREDAMFQAIRVRAHGTGDVETGVAPERGTLDRVLVVLIYETVEMDYLSPSAAEFLHELVQQYHTRGISLAGLYSDEMHIQQDWSYHSHMDVGQFTLRYVSPGLERAFAARYGEQYADLAPYLLYFCSHQHDFLPTHEPKLPSQHVFGFSVEDVQRTLRFRRDYYDLLEKAVVRLVIDAREELEHLGGRELDVFYHATWAESPTCDVWTIGGVHTSWQPAEHRRKYEYTPDFLWSNTVHQAASACANYFAWNDFLTGGNDDTPEGGYADRNYYGRALACSLAALNRRPLASAGMWGMPAPVRERMAAVSAVYGAGGHATYRAVAEHAPRQIEVLMVYPQDLVAVEERFGSWMVQYGYANLISADKLVEYGAVDDGAGKAAGQLVVQGPAITSRYRAVCVLYEPFPSKELMALLQELAEQGGTVIWSSIPPLTEDRDRWMADLFGARVEQAADPLGLALPARTIAFEGALDGVEPMTVLTDLVIDRVFAVQPLADAKGAGTECVARARTGDPGGARCVGTRKAYPGGGQAVYLGFRPRDDQSASTGTQASTWFELLYCLDAYTGDDNPTVVSRTSPYLTGTFANGTTAVCPHYCRHAESWPGGFFRDLELDAHLMEENPPPDDTISLDGLLLAGQKVTYLGRHAVAWRLDGDGGLIAFSGRGCTGIELDGQLYAWTETPVDVAWHPLGAEHAADGYTPLYRVWCGTEGQVCLPLGLTREPGLQVWRGALVPAGGRNAAEGRVGYGYGQIPFSVEEGALILDIDAESAERWLYVVLAS